MNCIYEMNTSSEQEVRGPQAQYHSMGAYTTLASPSAIMMMESAAANSNNNNNNATQQSSNASGQPDSIKQSSGDMLMVSSEYSPPFVESIADQAAYGGQVSLELTRFD